MGYSRLEYAYTGGGQVFEANFPLGYLQREDIRVYVRGEVDGTGGQALRQFRWVDDVSVEVTTPLPNPCTVIVDRTVDKTDLDLTRYAVGGYDPQTLVRTQRQSMMAVHEVLDGRVGDFGTINAAVEDLTKNRSVPFSSREAFENSNVPAELQTWAIIHPPIGHKNSRVNYYQRDTNGTACVSANGVAGSPAGEGTPYHFGAFGDWNDSTQTGTDDTAAVQAFLNWGFNDSTQTVNQKFLPGGKYRLTATLVIDDFSFDLIGAGRAYTVLVADHRNGPVLRTRRSGCNFEKFSVESSTARQNTAGLIPPEINALSGIENLAFNGAINGAANCTFNDLKIVNQPGHGMVIYGSGQEINQCLIGDLGGYGILFDNGAFTQNPLVVRKRVSITGNVVYNTAGTGIVIGNSGVSAADAPVQVYIAGNEVTGCGFGNAHSQGRCQIFMAGEQAEITQNTLSGERGIVITGRDIVVARNRHADHIFPAITISDGSAYMCKNIEIELGRIVNATMDPAIDITSQRSADDLLIRVTSLSTENIVTHTSDRSKVWKQVLRDATYYRGALSPRT